MDAYLDYLRKYNTVEDTEYKEKQYFKITTDKLELDNQIEKHDLDYSHLYDKEPLFFIQSKKHDISKYSYKELKVIACIIARFFRHNEISYKAYNDSDNVFFEITFKEIIGTSKETRYKRLCNPEYVFKKLEKQKIAYSEASHFLSEGGDYCSKVAIEIYENKIKNRSEYLASTGIDFGSGVVSMAELKDNADNAKISEIHMVNSIIDNLALSEGRVWLMSTLTLPRKFHINPKKGKRSYSKDLNVLDGDKALTATYRAAYNHLKKDVEREKIEDFYGVWSKEPHKNGSIHMHVLMYVLPNEVEIFKSRFVSATKNLFKKHNERYVKDVSVNFKLENKNYNENGKTAGRGSSYIFKYIMKSLNVLEYKPVNGKRIKIEDSERIAAHNSIYNYKRFSFVGIKNCLSKWRVVRQVAKKIIANSENDSVDFKEMYGDEIGIIFESALENNYELFSKINESISLNYSEQVNEYSEHLKTIIGFTINGFYFEKPTAVIIKNAFK